MSRGDAGLFLKDVRFMSKCFIRLYKGKRKNAGLKLQVSKILLLTKTGFDCSVLNLRNLDFSSLL